MKKTKTIILTLIIIDLIMITVLLSRHYKYTQKDVDTALNIYLNDIKPSKKQLKLYDLDKSENITLYDVVLIQKKVNEREK